MICVHGWCVCEGVGGWMWVGEVESHTTQDARRTVVISVELQQAAEVHHDQFPTEKLPTRWFNGLSGLLTICPTQKANFGNAKIGSAWN